jgi:hypothetical protein
MRQDVAMHGGLEPPFVVAHRAGNDLTLLRRAEHASVGLVEADLHLFAGRVEVRHLKTLGPVPVLWDRWKLAPPWAPRLLLEELLGACGPGTQLMLDLKGRDTRLAAAVAAALAADGGERAVTVCSRSWSLLAPLEAAPGVRVVHSVGSRRQLTALWRRAGAQPLAGVSIHRRLLDARITAALRERTDLLLAWPVATVDQARELGAWGVHGVITEHFEALAGALRPPGATAPAC